MPVIVLRKLLLHLLRSFWLHAVLAVIALVWLTGWLDTRAGSGLSEMYLETPWSALWMMLTNALPGLMLGLLLLAALRRVWLSFFLAGALTWLVYTINDLKVANLATPLVPGDFLMLGQVGAGGVELLGKYLPSSTAVGFALLGALTALLLLWRFEPPLATSKKLPRAAAAGLLLAAWASLLLTAPFWNAMYDADAMQFEPWSPKRSVKHAGLINTLVLYHLHYANDRPDADVGAAMALIREHRDALSKQLSAPSKAPFPDIVVVQSESFFDPSILKAYSAHGLTPELKRLRALGAHGRMHVPTFGGGTIRTEFEVLTGLNLRYFPMVQYPYLELHRPKIPSVLDALEQHGYTTTAIHPNRAEFWNRSTAFIQLGFDQFISQGYFPSDLLVDHRYAPDNALTDEILKQLKNHGPPQFLFAISMEAHGPYASDPDVDDAERASVPLPAGVDGAPAVALGNFLFHLRHADAELGRLADALAARKRPTLLLFYGDHLPGLVPAFKAAGFDNGQASFRQTVPWLLIQPGRPSAPSHRDIDAAMLPALLLQAAGIHDQPWFALTLLVGDELAPLSQAADAEPTQLTAEQARIDAAMDDVSWLRYRGKLAPLMQRTLH